MKKLLIIGAGGHARSVADAALALVAWDEIEFGDDGDIIVHFTAVVGVHDEFARFV